MKNKLRIFPFFITLLIMYLLVFTVGNIITDMFLEFNHIYRSKTDKYISDVIESTFKQVILSKRSYKKSKSNLNDIDINVKLDNIDMACYFISIYSTGYFDNNMQKVLQANGHGHYLFTRDIKRKMISRKGGEGSSAVLFIKKDGTILPIFPPGSYLDMNFPVENNDWNGCQCLKVKNGIVDINVNFDAKNNLGSLKIKH